MAVIGSPQQYLGRTSIFFNGTALEEFTSVDLALDTAQNEIVTVTKGLAGFSAGAQKTTIRITSAVPIGGTEIDFWDIAFRNENCTLQVGFGSKDFISTGRIMNVSLSLSANSPSAVDFDFTCVAKALQ